MRGIAEAADAAGHRVSAREAYLRAGSYLFAATGALDGTDDPDRMVPIWREHRECFERFGELCDPPVEPLEIPCDGDTLKGWFFAAGRLRLAAADRDPQQRQRRPRDRDVAAGRGRARPRLQRADLRRPRPGGGAVGAGPPVPPRLGAGDHPRRRPPRRPPRRRPDRIAILGVSQGGYWVPRAVAFEQRIAAAVADPGVVDVSTAWTENFPKSMIKLIDEGERDKFDKQFRFAEHFLGKTTRQTLAFRMKPYRTESMFEAIEAVRAYRLDDVVAEITTPMLITDPEDEQFWPGQSRRLFDALPGPDKEIVAFTAAEGANFHCEPMGQALADQRIFDWLDDRLTA